MEERVKTDVTIGACRPVNWAPYAHLFSEGFPEPTIYPGSTIQPCETCAEPIYVGPRMQEVPDITLMCFRCGAIFTAIHAQTGDDVSVSSLDNPYRPRR
jgi:hypothetical protein